MKIPHLTLGAFVAACLGFWAGYKYATRNATASFAGPQGYANASGQPSKSTVLTTYSSSGQRTVWAGAMNGKCPNGYSPSAIDGLCAKTVLTSI